MPTFDLPTLSIALCFICVSTGLHILLLMPRDLSDGGGRELALALLLCGISLPILAMRNTLGLGYWIGLVAPNLFLITGMGSAALGIFQMLEVVFSRREHYAAMTLWLLAYLATAVSQDRADLRFLVFNLMAVVFFARCAFLLYRSHVADFRRARSLLGWLLTLSSATFALRQLVAVLLPLNGSFEHAALNALTIFPMLIVVTSSSLVLEMITGAKVRRQIMDLASRDELTGLLNRKGLRWRLDTSPGVHRALVEFDIDHFKKINDRYGHLIGDQVLAEVGARIRMVTRHGDIAARLGGEEFLIMAAIAGPEFRLHEWAERIRRVITAEPVMTQKGPIEVRLSVGCSLAAPQDRFADAYRRADRALYQAKQSGRDKTVVFEANGPARSPSGT